MRWVPARRNVPRDYINIRHITVQIPNDAPIPEFSISVHFWRFALLQVGLPRSHQPAGHFRPLSISDKICLESRVDAAEQSSQFCLWSFMLIFGDLHLQAGTHLWYLPTANRTMGLHGKLPNTAFALNVVLFGSLLSVGGEGIGRVWVCGGQGDLIWSSLHCWLNGWSWLVVVWSAVTLCHYQC